MGTPTLPDAVDTCSPLSYLPGRLFVGKRLGGCS
jgi:hypothetical protein